MTTITIDIDKPYNDKSMQDARNRILSIAERCWNATEFRRSAHDRLHVNLRFPDSMSEILQRLLDSQIEDMYFILFRLAAGDDIRRLRTDAKKFFKGEDILHWLPSKDDYRKVAEREK